jgi:hypothetical protein
MFDEWSPLLVAVLFLVLLLATFVWNEQIKNKARSSITYTIEQHGGRVILIKTVQSFGSKTIGPKSGFTFQVTYYDYERQKQTTHCQVSSYGKTAGQVFWQKPIVSPPPTSPSKQQVIDSLAQENEQLRSALADKIETAATRSDSKEQIITDLTAENERLRAMLDEASNTPNSPT